MSDAITRAWQTDPATKKYDQHDVRKRCGKIDCLETRKEKKTLANQSIRSLIQG